MTTVGEPKRSKNRKADGTLKPARARYRERRNKARRRAWLANFDPRERKRFFKKVDLEKAIFLRGFARTLEMPEDECWDMLEKLADERGWMKLRTLTGRVVGIGPDKRADT